jgi:hypothetical protein
MLGRIGTAEVIFVVSVREKVPYDAYAHPKPLTKVKLRLRIIVLDRVKFTELFLVVTIRETIPSDATLGMLYTVEFESEKS